MQNPLIVPVKVLKGHKVQGELGMLNIYQTSGRFVCTHYGLLRRVANIVELFSILTTSRQNCFFFFGSGLSNLTRVRVFQ